MANLLYTYEKVCEAVRCLDVHEGGIKERLVQACHHGFVQVDRESLPDDLKPLYEEIWGLVQGEPHQSLGAFVPAIRKLSTDEAQRVAGLMVELKSGLEILVGPKD